VQIKAKKSLGQNFLIDKNIINKIVAVANIQPNDNILEIGPGTGNLTESILNKKPKKIYVIEKDERLVNLLSERFKNQITIINEDILKISEHSISNSELIVFGNLPYNISTQILSKWIINTYNKKWYKSLILMFQKEVANRILAKTNSKNYGRLTILSNWKLDVEKIIDISANCFSPKPKVESSLLKFTPKKKYFEIKDAKNLEMITRVFFNHRRKKIKNSFNQIFSDSKYFSEKLNLDLNLRPQNLSPSTYYLITKQYENLRG
jgi:16S rRNA (adenine1518-N6/adenine1519-N6)-dimethyltransferase